MLFYIEQAFDGFAFLLKVRRENAVRKIGVSAAVAMTLLAASSVSAQSRYAEYEYGPRYTGPYVNGSYTFNPKRPLEVSHTLQGDIGMRFGRFFATDVSLEWYDRQGEGNVRHSRRSRKTLLVGFRLIAPVTSRIDLYGGFGMGTFWAELEFPEQYAAYAAQLPPSHVKFQDRVKRLRFGIMYRMGGVNIGGEIRSSDYRSILIDGRWFRGVTTAAVTTGIGF